MVALVLLACGSRNGLFEITPNRNDAGSGAGGTSTGGGSGGGDPPTCTADRACDDYDACTLDRCSRGACTHSPVDCSDGDPCTDDTCDRVRGCVILPTTCCSSSIVEAEDALRAQRTSDWAVSFGPLHGGSGLESGSDQGGGSVRWTFEGRGLAVYYESGPNRGTFSVSIDGGPSTFVDCYAPSFELQVRALIASGLAMTLHTAELRDESTPAAPGYVAIDYFEALCE
jgi:hypothetical protein